MKIAVLSTLAAIVGIGGFSAMIHPTKSSGGNVPSATITANTSPLPSKEARESVRGHLVLINESRTAVQIIKITGSKSEIKDISCYYWDSPTEGFTVVAKARGISDYVRGSFSRTDNTFHVAIRPAYNYADEAEQRKAPSLIYVEDNEMPQTKEEAMLYAQRTFAVRNFGLDTLQ